MRLIALLMLVGCGFFAESNAQPINNAGYSGAVQQSNGPGDSAIYELLSRIEQLQSEVQQLRGVVEEQSQTIHDLERKQTNMYSDLDGRMQALTPANTQPPASAVPAGVAASSVQPQPATAGTAPVSAAQSQAQAAVQPPPVAAAVPAVASSAPAGSAPAAVSSAVTDSKPASIPAPSANKGNEKERYQLAYDTLRNGHNEQAVKMFESLLTDFPAGEFADNAQYWLAEAYKINRDPEKAKVAFCKVISQYPNSSKVPDSLLKLGYIEFDQQNIVKSRDYLTRVTTSYPDSTAAHLASKKLAQMPQR